MNVAAAMSLTAASVNLATAVFHLAISRAPGWRSARVFAAIALTAGLYNAVGPIFATDGLSPQAYIVAATVADILGSLNCVGWLVYAFGSQDDLLTSIPRSIVALIVLVLAVTALFTLTGWHVYPAVIVSEVPWAGVRYHFAVTSRMGDLYGSMMPAVLAIVFARFIVRVRRGERGLRWQLVGFTIFFFCVVIEVLVANRVIAFFSMADMGMLAAVLPISIHMVERLTADAQRLRELSGDLAGQVLQRTEERDRAESALVEAERLAALGRLAAGVGHEINNPLTYMQLALDDVEAYVARTKVPARVREAVGYAQDGAHRIQRAVEGLRSYSQRQDERAPVDLREVAAAALRVAQPHLRHVMRLDTVFGEVPRVLGDEARLVQAVVNVLVNAGQAVETQLASGHIEIQTMAGPDGAATLVVTDNGPGVPAEHLSKLTEPYFTTRAERGGLGLGLFVTRGIVDTHGGHFEIASTPGEGTRVTFAIPAMAAGEAGQLSLPTPQLQLVPMPARPDFDDDDDFDDAGLPAAAPGLPRALVIDDEPLVGKFFKSGLKAWWAVTCAASAGEALQMLETESFDVIACDVMMPGISGMEFASILEHRNPAMRARTLFLTGGAVTPAAEQFLDRPDVAYMTKPVRLKDLNERLRELRQSVAGGRGASLLPAGSTIEAQPRTEENTSDRTRDR